MEFAIGYQLSEAGEESFVEIAREYADHIAEVYFAWPGMASGRSPIGVLQGTVDPQAQERFESDLKALRALGVKLDVLFNANCYGEAAMSKELEARVGGVLDSLEALVGGVEIATTTSPAIAHMIKKHAPSIEVRASVNMRIGTVEGMAYLSELFDSYHVQRDYNRDLRRLRTLREWADQRGKRLIMLANSGCLRNCSAQSFHDNLVAHETGVAESDNIDFLPYACWNHLRDRANWPAALQATWVRPEDLHHYDELFDVVKLATRLHERPHVVVKAYVEQRFLGNLPDLMEPGFSRAFAPCVIDNARFPKDWFERTATCERECHRCSYCADVLEKVLVDLTG